MNTTPFLTGAVLVIGLLIVRPEIRGRFLAITGIGYYSKLFVVVVACFVLGYMFLCAIEWTTTWVLSKLNQLTKGWIAGRAATSNPPWRSRVWQKLATEMIGELAPKKLWADDRVAIDESKERISLILDDQQRASEMKRIAALESELQKTEAAWRRWYFVLKAYFDLPDERTNEYFFSYISMHSLGWAGIVVALASGHPNWFALTICVLLVICGVQGTLFRMRCVAYFGFDNQLDPLSAAILHEIRSKHAGLLENDRILNQKFTHR